MVPGQFSFVALLTYFLPQTIGQSYNGLAVTPAMGWNNWNAFECDVSEDLLLETAQKMMDLGLKDAGYQYVVLDDCWSAGRYENGSLKPDFTKFPNGMKDIGDKLHALGLKFGMYSSAGYLTCAKYPASLGKEDIDAQTFADWGVDYLKYDNCYNGGQAGTQKLTYDRYKTMSDALNRTGRPILYGMCNWGEDGPWNWAQTMANSWRMSGDITDSFSRPGVTWILFGSLRPANYAKMIDVLARATSQASSVFCLASTAQS